VTKNNAVLSHTFLWFDGLSGVVPTSGCCQERGMESSGGFVSVTWAGMTPRWGLGRTADWSIHIGPFPHALGFLTTWRLDSERKHPDSKHSKQDQEHNLQGPVQNENAGPLFQND